MSKIDEHIALLIKAADEVFAEATRMRAELAKYELQPAMKAAADPYELLGMGPRYDLNTATGQRLAEAQNGTTNGSGLPKMPWEQ